MMALSYISKLDYINDGDPTTDTDLGFTGIWLMPIMPSTTYHKYDVINYKDIDKQYGTLEDFEQLRMGYGYGLGVRTHMDKTRSGSLSPIGEFGWDGWTGNYVTINPQKNMVLKLQLILLLSHHLLPA